MQGSRSINYIPHIDGLRGLAVLIILLFHLDVAFVSGGFIGVDVFFVISGYLITSIIMREIQEGRFSFANFYARRIRRIFPALFVMLFLTSFGAVVFLGLEQYSQFFKALRYASGQISNFFFSGEVDYFADSHDHSPLLHTWSLGVEEQFYLVWPILLIGIHKFLGLQKSLFVLGGLFVVSLGVSEYLVHNDSMQAFYMLHSRAWQLAMGGIVALNILPAIENKRIVKTLAVASLALIVIPALFYSNENFPGLKAFVPCFGAALFIYTGRQEITWTHKIMSMRGIVFTGLISYSLYLWHWPLIAFYKQYTAQDLTVAVQLILGIGAVAFGLLSYKFVEQPFRSKKSSSFKTIAYGVLVIVLFVAVSNVVKKESDAPWRINYPFDEAQRSAHPLDRICSVNGGAYNEEECVIGPNKDSYEVILSGDSHASHYTHMVLGWAKSKGLTVRIFLRGACKTWVDSDEERLRYGKRDQYCMDLTKDFYKRLENDKSIRYIFLGKYLPAPSKENKKSLERIKSYGPSVYYLGQTPIFEGNPHDCLIRNNLLLTHWFPRDDSSCLKLDLEYSDMKMDEVKEFRALLKDLGIPYYDPEPSMQDAFDEEGRFLYMDSNHMNIFGSQSLVPSFAEFMEQHPAKEPRRN